MFFEKKIFFRKNIIFEMEHFQKPFIFPTYSTVPASGIARRDPPRHVVVVIPSFIKIRFNLISE